MHDLTIGIKEIMPLSEKWNAVLWHESQAEGRLVDVAVVPLIGWALVKDPYGPGMNLPRVVGLVVGRVDDHGAAGIVDESHLVAYVREQQDRGAGDIDRWTKTAEKALARQQAETKQGGN